MFAGRGITDCFGNPSATFWVMSTYQALEMETLSGG